MSAPILLSYRTLGLGDLLTSVPALRALRAAYPAHRHVLATPRWLGAIVDLVGAVDEHPPVGELEPVPLKAGEVDVAANLHGRGPQSHRVIERLAPRRALAFHHPDVAWTRDAPRWVSDEHETDRWSRLLATSGIRCDPSDLRLAPPAVDPPVDAAGATVLHPGAKAPARRWPADRFAAVARHESSAGRRVLLTGSAEEEPLARAVAWAAGLRDRDVLAGRTDTGALVALIAGAERVVCGDTGVAHLATALDTPSVVLFGPTPPDAWGPRREDRDRHRVLWAGCRGDPLGDRPDEGLLEITVADVIAELERLAGRLRRPA